MYSLYTRVRDTRTTLRGDVANRTGFHGVRGPRVLLANGGEEAVLLPGGGWIPGAEEGGGACAAGGAGGTGRQPRQPRQLARTPAHPNPFVRSVRRSIALRFRSGYPCLNIWRSSVRFPALLRASSTVISFAWTRRSSAWFIVFMPKWRPSRRAA